MSVGEPQRVVVVEPLFDPVPVETDDTQSPEPVHEPEPCARPLEPVPA